MLRSISWRVQPSLRDSQTKTRSDSSCRLVHSAPANSREGGSGREGPAETTSLSAGDDWAGIAERSLGNVRRCNVQRARRVVRSQNRLEAYQHRRRSPSHKRTAANVNGVDLRMWKIMSAIPEERLRTSPICSLYFPSSSPLCLVDSSRTNHPIAQMRDR